MCFLLSMVDDGTGKGWRAGLTIWALSGRSSGDRKGLK